jgi:hypothetical protein
MNIYITSEQIGLQGYWITDILEGIAKESLKKNITILDYTGEKPELTDEYTRPLVLAIGHSYQWIENTCRQMKKKGAQPLIVNAGLDIYTETFDAAGFVSFGIQKAMHQIINYLIQNKRTKIAFFGAHDETHSDQVKIDEFLKLSAHMQLPLGPSDVYRDLTISDCAKSFELNMHRYNAVVCSSDAAAVYLLKWLEERGKSAPEDLFVIGFGNTLISKAIKPSLTTVENDFVELGRRAVKLHQFLQRNNDIDTATVLVDCPLIERQTTGEIRFKKSNPRSLSNSMPLYDADPDILTALQLEELLRMWDDIDRQIIKGLLNDKTIISIADGLFISVSAVKYRIRKMLTAASFKNKEELVLVLKKYNIT